MEFKESQTRENLMRAFAGESQARNRYTFSASVARSAGLHGVERVFRFTAEQEKEHAEIFYRHMKPAAGRTVSIDGGYPVDQTAAVAQLLRRAQHNEYEEFDPVYPAFAETAQAEGFAEIAASFRNIAAIEQTHGSRFGYFADLLEREKLFVSDAACGWMCLNCGHIHQGTEAPKLCPVCRHEQGYFIRLELAPWGGAAVLRR